MSGYFDRLASRVKPVLGSRPAVRPQKSSDVDPLGQSPSPIRTIRPQPRKWGSISLTQTWDPEGESASHEAGQESLFQPQRTLIPAKRTGSDRSKSLRTKDQSSIQPPTDRPSRSELNQDNQDAQIGASELLQHAGNELAAPASDLNTHDPQESIPLMAIDADDGESYSEQLASEKGWQTVAFSTVVRSEQSAPSAESTIKVLESSGPDRFANNIKNNDGLQLSIAPNIRPQSRVASLDPQLLQQTSRTMTSADRLQLNKDPMWPVHENGPAVEQPVTIHIGRVEVRAAKPPVVQKRTPVKAPTPADRSGSSLSDYLAKRHRGER